MTHAYEKGGLNSNPQLFLMSTNTKAIREIDWLIALHIFTMATTWLTLGILYQQDKVQVITISVHFANIDPLKTPDWYGRSGDLMSPGVQRPNWFKDIFIIDKVFWEKARTGIQFVRLWGLHHSLVWCPEKYILLQRTDTASRTAKGHMLRDFWWFLTAGPETSLPWRDYIVLWADDLYFVWISSRLKIHEDVNFPPSKKGERNSR